MRCERLKALEPACLQAKALLSFQVCDSLRRTDENMILLGCTIKILYC